MKPTWRDFLPTERGFAMIGIFALVTFYLCLLAFAPGLRENDGFKTIGTLLFGTGGLGLVIAYLWGGSKASVAAAESVNEIARGAAPAAAAAVAAAAATAANPQPVEVVNKPTDPVPVEPGR